MAERYSIYEEFVPELIKKAKKIQRKCEKYGCAFSFRVVGEELKDIKAPSGTVSKFRFIIVEAEGTAVINDWEFCASVEHTSKGNIFNKALADVEIPERYRFCEPFCEHCNTRRFRKDTYIVHNTKTDEFKQVGKSCLMDYTRGMSVEYASLALSFRTIFAEAGEKDIFECGASGFGKAYFPLREILLYGAETIRHFGYKKTRDDYGYCTTNSTKERTIDFFQVATGRTQFMPKQYVSYVKETMEKIGFNANSAEATEMVDKALAWIASQPAKNDYMHNLKVTTSLGFVDYEKVGVLVSLFPTCDRELAYQAEKEAREEAQRIERSKGKNSQWVGNIGDRITVEVDSVKCVASWENSFNYGSYTYLYKIVGKDGNIYMWRTSTDLEIFENLTTLIGTVKDHDEYKGIYQTVLTRCKVA